MGETPGPGSVGGDYVAGDKHLQQVAGGDIVGRDKIVNYAAPAVGVAALRQLPAPPVDFTGRTAELDELRAAAEALAPDAPGLIGVRGPAGVGKTALALVLARALAPHYPDAHLYVDLRGAAQPAPLDPSEALAGFIRAFAPTAQLPEGLAERQAIYRSLLTGRRALVLLENARDRAQVEPLLPPPGSLALITSRQRFTLPGLLTHTLASLPRADATALLLKIAPRIGAEAEALAQLCGDLPLALRLAGSALAERENLTPAAYAARLRDNQRLFKELSEVEAALALSHALLPPALQAAWPALAVFPADFDWPAAAAVWTGLASDAAEADTTDALGELLRYSLLDFEAATARYRLPNLGRAWAAAQLSAEAGETARQRHAGHFGAILYTADQWYLQGGDGVLSGLGLFDREQANIEAGQAWAAARAADNPVAAQYCQEYPEAGAFVIDLRLPPRKRLVWLEAALAAAERAQDQASQQHHLLNVGSAHADQGDGPRAVAAYERALALARERGDRLGEGQALGSLGLMAAAQGDPRRAIDYYEQHRAITRAVGDDREEGRDLLNLGNAYADLGDLPRAVEFYDEALAAVRAQGDRRTEGQVLGNLGTVYNHLDQPGPALEQFRQHQAIALALGDQRGVAIAQWNSSLSLNRLGDRPGAMAQAEAALAGFERLEDPLAERVRRRLEEWKNER